MKGKVSQLDKEALGFQSVVGNSIDIPNEVKFYADATFSGYGRDIYIYVTLDEDPGSAGAGATFLG